MLHLHEKVPLFKEVKQDKKNLKIKSPISVGQT